VVKRTTSVAEWLNPTLCAPSAFSFFTSLHFDCTILCYNTLRALAAPAREVTPEAAAAAAEAAVGIAPVASFPDDQVLQLFVIEAVIHPWKL